MFKNWERTAQETQFRGEMVYLNTSLYISYSGESNGNPLQYSCMESPMNGGAWWAAVHGVAKSQTRLHFHFSLSCIGEGNGNPLVFLLGESQGWGSLVGCHLWGHTETDMTEET